MDELPHLAQLVLLDRHELAPVLTYLTAVKRMLLARDPHRGQTLTSAEALSLKPLSSLIQRTTKLQQKAFAEPLKRKPYRLKVPYDEMVTVRLYYARMLSYASQLDAHLQLQTALGKFHQPSLNIENHIRLVPATGPGCQMTLL